MKMLDALLATRAFDHERTYSERLNVSFQPDSQADFQRHPEFDELFRLFTREDAYRGMDIARLWSFALNIKQVLARVDGSFAELGVYKGHSAAVLGWFARRHARRLYLLDTFAGFAQEELETTLSDNARVAFRDTSLEVAQATVGLSDGFRWLVGTFPASLTPEIQDDRFAFVSIDCDLYEPISAGLRFFWPRLRPGGMIFVHDYSSGHWPGATRAVDEFADRSGIARVLLPDKSGSVVLAKPARSDAASETTGRTTGGRT